MQIKLKLLPLAMLALSESLLAQQIPGAGSQLRQLETPPVPPKTEAKISIEEATSPVSSNAPSASVLVNEMRFTGVEIYSSSQLLAIARFTPGRELTLQELQEMAARITAEYRNQGYFVARAYLPVQDISNHVVTITVSEGKLGQVVLQNKSRLSDDIANSQLAGLNSGDPILIEPLENRLLLLSDVPGVKVSSTLVPGSVPGSSDLIVNVVPDRLVSGQVDFDNAGNPYTGEYRLGATVNFNNMAGRGDVFSLRAVSSGSGLNYGRASYQMMFGRATFGLAYSRLEYELGEQFEVLGANGTATVASIFGSVPLIRSRKTNLYLGFVYDEKTLDDRLDMFPISNRDADVKVATVYLNGNRRDQFGGGGVNSFYIGLSSGSLDILTPLALTADAASARSNGSYQKLVLNASRWQHLSDSWSLYASATAQMASKNLDPSEKFSLGGMDGSRGYPTGEAIGDEGYLFNLEARYLLSNLSDRVPGQMHLLAFVDGGTITIDKNPWYIGDNKRSLSSAGVGAMWTDPGNFALRMYYAVKLGDEVALSAPDKSGRFWIQAIKYF